MSPSPEEDERDRPEGSAPMPGASPVPEQTQPRDVAEAEREGGIGAMRESTVGEMPGGGGDTGRGTQGREGMAGAAGDGVPMGDEAEAAARAGDDGGLGPFRTTGPSADAGAGEQQKRRRPPDPPPRYTSPPPDGRDLGPPSAARVPSAGAAAPGGEPLPGDTARDHAGGPITVGGAPPARGDQD